MFTGKVRNEEMRKRDFRKALQITGIPKSTSADRIKKKLDKIRQKCLKP